jgi:hypothetical protein
MNETSRPKGSAALREDTGIVMPWVKRQVAPRTATEAVDGTLEALVASHCEACRGGNRAVKRRVDDRHRFGVDAQASRVPVAGAARVCVAQRERGDEWMKHGPGRLHVWKQLVLAESRPLIGRCRDPSAPGKKGRARSSNTTRESERATASASAPASAPSTRHPTI